MEDTIAKITKLEDEHDAKLVKDEQAIRDYINKVMSATYKSTAACDNAWDEWHKKFNAGINYEVKKYYDPMQYKKEIRDKLKELSEERYKTRQITKDKLVEEVKKAEIAFALKLSKDSQNIKDYLNAKWFLSEIYNKNTLTEDLNLKALVKKASADYDKTLVTKFKNNGGLGVWQRGKGGCVFSTKAFPENPGSEVTAPFTTYIEGNTEVHVLYRLEKSAKNYAGYLNGSISLQLISINDGFELVVAEKEVGKPEVLGDKIYLTTSFKLPPKKFDKNTRWYFRAQAILNYNKTFDNSDYFMKLTTNGGSFFWHR